MSFNGPDIRRALLGSVVTLAALLLAWPFAKSAFNDDWSYAFTVQRLLKTGQLQYNGWATATVIAHVYWGAAWVALLQHRTSLCLFDILRLSTMPYAAGATAICYALARRCGLMPSRALFASLTLGCSPLFLPLAASFMTDVPALFMSLLSLYALACASEERSTRSAYTWLVVGVLSGFVGGTSRQIVWVVPLVILPFAAWRRRDCPAIVAAATASWLLVVIGIVLTLRWYSRQPFALPEPSPLADFAHVASNPAHFARGLVNLWLTIALVVLPATIELLSGCWGRCSRLAIPIVVLFLCIAAVRPRSAIEPWMENTLCINGVLGNNELAGRRPVTLVWPIRAALSLGVFATSAVMLASPALWLMDRRPIWPSARLLFGAAQLPAMLAALGIFAVAYVGLLLPRTARDMAFDRYVLPLIPCVAIPVLLYGQRRRLRGAVDSGTATVTALPIASWALLGLYCFYGIATTQELYALARARASATARLEQAGIPRVRIEAGFEYNRWTELEVAGHIGRAAALGTPGVSSTGRRRATPHLQPLYRVEFQPAVDTNPTAFGVVDYRTYLPPFRRELFINRFVDPWWLDLRRAATPPASLP